MVIVSLSGGKDSVAAATLLVEQYGAGNVVAHYQVLPADWPETLDYVQSVCAKLGIALVAQQAIYIPRPGPTGTETAFLRAIDIFSAADIVPEGTPGTIAGLVDLAYRRGWPPGYGVRWCTSYFKEQLFDYWLRRNRHALTHNGEIIVVNGERAAESRRRAQKPSRNIRLQWKREGIAAINWRIIQTWSRRDTFRRLRDWGIDPHPAYQAQGMSAWQMYDADAEGGPRQSCRYCIYASYADLCHQAQIESTHSVLRRLVNFEKNTGVSWWPELTAVSLLNQ